MNKLKEKFGFEFWQKFGKALMVVIAVMPAAGLMITSSLPSLSVEVGLRNVQEVLLQQVLPLS